MKLHLLYIPRKLCFRILEPHGEDVQTNLTISFCLASMQDSLPCHGCKKRIIETHKIGYVVRNPKNSPTFFRFCFTKEKS